MAHNSKCFINTSQLNSLLVFSKSAMFEKDLVSVFQLYLISFAYVLKLTFFCCKIRMKRKSETDNVHELTKANLFRIGFRWNISDVTLFIYVNTFL